MRSPHRIIFLQLLWLWHLFYTSIVLYFCRFCPPTPHGEPWPLAPRFRRDGGGTPRLAATDWTADHSRGRGAPGATARRVSSWARESRRWGWWWMFAAAFLFLVSRCWDLLDLSWFIRWLLWWRWEWILKGYLFDSNSNHGLFAWNPHVFWGMFFPMIRSLQTHTEWANPEAVSGREVGAICEAVRFLVLMMFFLPICFELIWYIFSHWLIRHLGNLPLGLFPQKGPPQRIQGLFGLRNDLFLTYLRRLLRKDWDTGLHCLDPGRSCMRCDVEDSSCHQTTKQSRSVASHVNIA